MKEQTRPEQTAELSIMFVMQVDVHLQPDIMSYQRVEISMLILSQQLKAPLQAQNMLKDYYMMMELVSVLKLRKQYLTSALWWMMKLREILFLS